MRETKRIQMKKNAKGEKNNMAANVETMFSVREKPWHGLGVIVEDAPSSKDALRLAGLDWRVVQKPLFTDSGLVEGYKANIRESDDSVLGVVTDRYKVVQNKNKGVLECQFQIGYKGLIDLAYRNGQMQTIQAHVIFPLDTGVMLSEDVLHKYINRKIPQKIKREKMQECILRCRKEKGNAGMLDSSFMGTEKRTEKVWEYFQKLDVSPIPLKAECPYVPSVSQLIYGENEESSVIQKFAMKHTRGKEYWRNE